MKTVDFLDAVKARHRLTSDYKLAKFLRWPTQRISSPRWSACRKSAPSTAEAFGVSSSGTSYTLCAPASTRRIQPQPGAAGGA